MQRLQLERFMGRLGNQLIQYWVARASAQRLGCRLETPDWIGRRVFRDVHDPVIARRLPGLPAEQLPDRPNTACHGFWQFQAAFDRLRRGEVRAWTSFRPEIDRLCPKPRPFYIACHVRRGDYVQYQDRFAVVEKACFLNALKQYGYDEKDVIWLTEEAPQPGSERLPPHLRMLYDFQILMKADVIFRSNSTFSQCAAILSHAKCYSPLVGDKVGIREDVEFVEGNWAANLSMKYHPVPHSDMRLAE